MVAQLMFHEKLGNWTIERINDTMGSFLVVTGRGAGVFYPVKHEDGIDYDELTARRMPDAIKREVDRLFREDSYLS